MSSDSGFRNRIRKIKARHAAEDNMFFLGKIIEAARSVINMGVHELPYLIVDRQGVIRWPEAYDYRKQLHRQRYSMLYSKRDEFLSKYRSGDISKEQYKVLATAIKIPPITVEETLDTLEAYAKAGALRFQMIDYVLDLLSVPLRAGLEMGLALARGYLKIKTEERKKLQSMRSAYVLELIQDERTVQAYNWLKDRPHLLHFVSEYALQKLGVPEKKLVDAGDAE